MDAMIYMEKIASLKDGSFGSMIASDILTAVNTKLASASKEAGVRKPTESWLSYLSQQFGPKKHELSRRLSLTNQYNAAAPKLDLNSAQLKYVPPMPQTQVFTGQLQGQGVTAGFGPNRPQVRQQIFNKEVGKQ